jgi:aerobic carbon-monoxide dehydrogenase small subunit
VSARIDTAADPLTGGSLVRISCSVNGEPHELEIEPWELAVDVLRDDLGLTGTKRSCDVEVCGTCTVLLDGAAISSCTTLAAELAGREVITVEGLATDHELSPIQQAFVDAGALQCGYCTPGFVTSCHALAAEQPDADEADITHYLAGNICRCTGYTTILAAAKDALRRAHG